MDTYSDYGTSYCLTLTLKPEDLRDNNYNTQSRKLITWFEMDARRLGFKATYVIEKTQKGNAHLHALIRYLKTTKSKNWKMYGHKCERMCNNDLNWLGYLMKSATHSLLRTNGGCDTKSEEETDAEEFYQLDRFADHVNIKDCSVGPGPLFR